MSSPDETLINAKTLASKVIVQQMELIEQLQNQIRELPASTLSESLTQALLNATKGLLELIEARKRWG